MNDSQQNTPPTSRKIPLPRLIILALLVLILSLSLRFRIIKILDSPGWFRDEGTYLEVARRIGKAQLQLGSVNITFVGPNMTHPPFYFTQANLFFKLTDADMYGFRLFNAILGLLATFLLFLLGREAGRYGNPTAPPSLHAEFLGLVAAFFYAIHPDAVLYNRMGMPYNLYLVEGTLMAWFALRYLRTREFGWCLGACIVASISLLTVYYSIAFIPFLFLIILWKGKRRHFWALVCVPVPLLIFLSFMALGNMPGFWEDIRALRKAAGAGSLYVTLYHYHDFFKTGITYFIGMMGLLLLRRKTAAGFLFLLYLLMIHMVLRKADTIVWLIHYPVIPILPLEALGCAAVALRAWDALWDLSPVALLLIPILLSAYLAINQDRHGIYGRFPTPLEFGMTKNTSDNFAVADYINTHVKPDDLVITPSVLWALVNAQTADLFQSVAFEGQKVDFYRQSFPRERFLFSPALDRASFVVLDSFTDQLKMNPLDSPHRPLLLAIMKVEKNWELAHTQGEYRVYRNPEGGKTPPGK